MIKDWWHWLWGCQTYPINVHMRWHQYFRSDFRAYVKAVQDEMNSKKTLTIIEDHMLDFMLYGTSVIKEEDF